MSLKTASIFKDFIITVNAENTAVTFNKVAAITASVKNDNFAEQVQILDNADTTDLFDYKYITFDDSAVFEIKDCIKNEKYTTLFIQYLSNITFAAANSNFRVDGVSVSKLQRLGFDINQFAEILGNSLKIDYVNYDNINITGQTPFMYGIKLRFSELPQNLSFRFTGLNNDVVAVTGTLNVGSRSYNPSIANMLLEPDNTIHDTSQDNAKVVIIPMPISPITKLNFDTSNFYQFRFTDFISTLSELIADLTLSAEVIIINSGTLMLLHDTTPKKIEMSNSVGMFDVRIDSLTLPDTGTDKDNFLNLIRVPADLVSGGATTSAPCFVMGGLTEIVGIDVKNYSFFENLNFIKINLPKIEANESYINAAILDNSIDLSKLKNNYFYIKRESGYIRIYIDIEKNIYTDIVTTLEFAKDAYSNFDAYKKANVELVNSQTNATLQQQQQQKRGLQTVNSVTSGVNTAIGAVSQFASGNTSGGITGLLSGGANIASEEIKFNMQQQNEKANNKLAAAQALESARSTITPSSDLKGSVNLVTALKGAYNETRNYITPIILSKITLTNIQLYSVQKHIFHNLMTEKITDISQITKPEWQTLFNYYQIKITNRSAINTRKDLIIFAED